MESTHSTPTVPSVKIGHSPVAFWKPILFGALAGAMGWGIRGQYGHETGAMIAGLLVSLVLILLICPNAPLLNVMRAAALGTIAIGFGGSMTYGQTVGLTHDVELIGNWPALRWGMLGLAVKGGIWIGFAGAFLGLGLGGIRYRAIEMLLVMLGLLGLCWIGIRLLNEPFDPDRHILPRIYFSDDWRWEPGASLKPRREVWGGLLFALIGLIVYAMWRRGDTLAFRMALWGMLGGAIGFPLGQTLQAFHAWNPEVFRSGFWVWLDPRINWWNWMETTFGAVMGGALGLGLWLNHGRVRLVDETSKSHIPLVVACGLLAIHIGLLASVEFLSLRIVDSLYDFGLILGLIPIVCVIGDRGWPYWILPITILPVAGKTLRDLVYRQAAIDPVVGWMFLFVLPMAAAVLIAVWMQRTRSAIEPAERSLRLILLLTTWVFFGLNFAFFRFPWPWVEWTARTPNALAFFVCAAGLTILALIPRPRTEETVG